MKKGLLPKLMPLLPFLQHRPKSGFEEVHWLRGVSGGVPCAGEGGAQRAWEVSAVTYDHKEAYSVLLLSGDVPGEGDFGISTDPSNKLLGGK